MLSKIWPHLSATLSLGVLLSATSAFAQSLPTISSVEVAYIAGSGVVETWNVDPQTGLATNQGQTVVPPAYFSLVPSADDHFVYIEGPDPSTGTGKLWVFPTDANGVLQASPIQEVSLANFTSNLTISPSGTFAYAVQEHVNSKGYEISEILLFSVNPATGILSGPTVAIKYPAGGLCKSQLEDGYPILLGFNPNGTALYDYWNCNFHEDGTVDYYALKVNPSTGALSSDTKIFSTAVTTGGGFDMVDFTPRNLIDFNVPNDYQIGMNSVNVYSLSGGSTPIFSCGASMLEACGYALRMYVDPTGRFVFLQTASDYTQETRLNLTAKRIANTQYYLPATLLAFSPDDTLIYGQLPNNSSPPAVYPVYTFNSSTGALGINENAQISTQQTLSTLVPAVRK